MMPEHLFSSPFLYSLALTLLHFIWQGCLVAFLLKLTFILIPQNKPQLRYGFSTLAMLINLALPFVTFFIIYQPDTLNFSNVLQSIPLSEFGMQLAEKNNAQWYSELVELLPYISLLWLASVTFLSSKLLLEMYSVNNLPKHSIIPTDQRLQTRFLQLVKQIELPKPPQLLVSLKAEVPMAIGWLKPVVLLPASMVSGLTSAQLEMLILHELAHIKRYDYLVNFIQTLVETLLFFHPAVRWISNQMRNEREYCSDDIAVQHSGDPIAYAHTLADTAALCRKHRHHTIPGMAMAASGGDLKQRVVRLVNHHCAPSNDLGKWFAAATIIFAFVALSTKHFLILTVTDVWSGSVPLYQSTSDKSFTVQKFDLLPLSDTSIAQQLLHNETDIKSSPSLLENEIVIASKTVNHEINTLAIDTQELVAIKKFTTPSYNAAERVYPAKKKITNKPKLIVEKAVQVATTQDVLFEPADKKTLSELAFERTDSTHNQSATRNPYADQVKELAQKPAEQQSSLIAQPQFEVDKIEPFLEPIKIVQQTPVWHDAELLKSVEPRYPTVAKRKGLELEVQVFFTIGLDGRISDIQFEQQSKVSYFRTAIRTAMQKWSFLPAMVDGKPVESQMSKIFSFSLQG